MSYKNSFTVYIDGINRTANAVMPLKWGDFLDERLDELYLSLRRIKKAHFEPLTSVEIVLSKIIQTIVVVFLCHKVCIYTSIKKHNAHKKKYQGSK